MAAVADRLVGAKEVVSFFLTAVNWMTVENLFASSGFDFAVFIGELCKIVRDSERIVMK